MEPGEFRSQRRERRRQRRLISWRAQRDGTPQTNEQAQRGHEFSDLPDLSLPRQSSPEPHAESTTSAPDASADSTVDSPNERLSLTESIAIVGQRAFDIGPSLYACLQARGMQAQRGWSRDNDEAVRETTLLLLDQLARLNALASGHPTVGARMRNPQPAFSIGSDRIDADLFFDSLVMVAANALGEAFHNRLHLEWRLVIDELIVGTEDA